MFQTIVVYTLGIYYAAGFLIGLPYIYYTLDNNHNISVDDINGDMNNDDKEWEYINTKTKISEIEMVLIKKTLTQTQDE